jgi:hypothetical protein
MHEPHDTTDEEPIPDTLRMFPATAEARAELDGVLDALGSDEVRVLARIAERLKMGTRTYGPLQVGQDARAFRGTEAREELEDALVYFACAWLKAETKDANR